MRPVAIALLAAAAALAGCGGSSGGSTSSGARPAKTAKPAPDQHSAAAAVVLGVAGRYVDGRVASGDLPGVHVGRAGVVGRVAVVYLVGGSDVGGGGRPVKGLYGVLVLVKSGGSWQVRPPVVAVAGHS